MNRWTYFVNQLTSIKNWETAASIVVGPTTLLSFLLIGLFAFVGFVINDWVLGQSEALRPLVIGPLHIIFDGIWRGRNWKQAGWRSFYRPTCGGYMLYIPLWGWGLFLIVMTFIQTV